MLVLRKRRKTSHYDRMAGYVEESELEDGKRT